MSVPGKRRARSEKRRRASHFALKKRILTVCAHCKKAILPHMICPFCGYYKGREVIHIRLKKEKEKRKKDKEKKRGKG